MPGLPEYCAGWESRAGLKPAPRSLFLQAFYREARGRHDFGVHGTPMFWTITHNHTTQWLITVL